MDINRIRSNINQYYANKKQEYLRNKNKRRNDIWLKYYSSQEWKTLRNNYYQLHPCCECHEKYNVIVPTTSIHHKKPFSKGITEEAKWQLLLNPRNLIACCDACHKEFHKQLREQNLDYLEEIIPVEFQNV